MEKKKQQKKVTKTKPKPKVIKQSGNPIVVGESNTPETIVIDAKKIPEGFSGLTGDKGPRPVILPEGFKTADKVTEKDDLEFENKKLRDLLTMWNHKRKFNGVWYYFMVDPLNQTIDMFDTDPTGGGQ